MSVNEKSALKLTCADNPYFFCSEHCLEKFVEKNNVSKEEIALCLIHPKSPFYKNKTIIVTLVLTLAVFLSCAIPILTPFRKTLFIYFNTIWWVILLGVVANIIF